MSGKHAYRLSAAGIEVFPRLADPIDPAAYPLTTERISSGIPALDAMLDDGYWPGAVTLVAGLLGIGQNPHGPPLYRSGARRGDPGIIATLQENPTQLTEDRSRGSAGRSRNLGSSCCAARPLTCNRLTGRRAPGGHRGTSRARRVLIDSLGDLAFAAGRGAATAAPCTPWYSRCSRLGVSLP